MPSRLRLVPLPGDDYCDRYDTRRRPPLELAERLWPKVLGPWYSTREHPIGPDDCRYWISPARAGTHRVRNGQRRPAGVSLCYGRIRRGRRRDGTIAAHRAAWLVTYGPVPEGRLLRHRCDQPLCCNPRHLVVGTAAENAADRIARRNREEVAS